MTVGSVTTRTVSIVIPAYNEAGRLVHTLPCILDHVVQLPYVVRVLIVNDGSGDETEEVVRSLMPEHSKLDVIALGRQRGKGAAVRAGVLASSSDVIGFMDADLSTSLRHIGEAVEVIVSGADVVIGSRALMDSQTLMVQPLYRRIGARIFREITRLMGELPDTPDAQCGFKFFRGSVAHDLFGSTVIDRWMFDLEVLRLALHRGYRIAQVPVEWTNDPESRLRLTMGTLRMVRDLARIRWRFRTGCYGTAGQSK